jgi:hypothetical protein
MLGIFSTLLLKPINRLSLFGATDGSPSVSTYDHDVSRPFFIRFNAIRLLYYAFWTFLLPVLNQILKSQRSLYHTYSHVHTLRPLKTGSKYDFSGLAARVYRLQLRECSGAYETDVAVLVSGGVQKGKGNFSMFRDRGDAPSTRQCSCIANCTFT